MTCAQDAKPELSGSPTTGGSLEPVPADSLTLLISALHEQTAAINRLAASNEGLIQAMCESEGMEDLPDPGTYMDGTPRG